MKDGHQGNTSSSCACLWKFRPPWINVISCESSKDYLTGEACALTSHQLPIAHHTKATPLAYESLGEHSVIEPQHPQIGLSAFFLLNTFLFPFLVFVMHSRLPAEKKPLMTASCIHVPVLSLGSTDGSRPGWLLLTPQ